jgi:NaMN:DMB phosphoribosyltransferase
VADYQYLYYGHCKSVNKVHVTTKGKPNPAIISGGALKLAYLLFLNVDDG